MAEQMNHFKHDNYHYFDFGNRAARIIITVNHYGGIGWEYWHANRKMKEGYVSTMAQACKKGAEAKRLYRKTYSGTFKQNRAAAVEWNAFK